MSWHRCTPFTFGETLFVEVSVNAMVKELHWLDLTADSVLGVAF